MGNSYHEVETSFQSLRRKYRSGEISRREFIDQLKKLRLRDEEGHFWMIGAQSGKWYYFDGKEWIQAAPPAREVKKVKCYSCGLENEAEAESCERCGESLKEEEASCPRCGLKLDSPFQKCPACRQEAEAAVPFGEDVSIKKKETEKSALRRINPVSLFYLSGGFGLVLGIILGAFVGASGVFAGLGQSLPEFLGTLNGTLMGGIIFAVLGGVIGFAFLGLIGCLEAHIFNTVSSIMGGLKITLEEAREEEDEKRKSS